MDQIKNKVAQTLGQDPLGVSGEQDIDKFNTARIPGDTAGGGVGNSINPDIDRFANAEDVLKPKPGGRQGEEVAPGGNGGGGGGVENAINPDYEKFERGEYVPKPQPGGGGEASGVENAINPGYEKFERGERVQKGGENVGGGEESEGKESDEDRYLRGERVMKPV